MPKFVPVSNTQHADFKVKEDVTFSHVKKQHILPLVIHEFARAAHDYPIVFVKDGETGQFRCVALLGLKPEQNVFYNEERWQASYIPECLRGYPFVLAADKNVEDQQILYFDQDSERVNQQDGQALFNEKGEQTEFITNMGNFLSDLVFKQQQTDTFIKALLEDSLITPQTLEVSLKGKDTYKVNGLYLLDEKALNELSDKKFLGLKKKGFLPPIYAALFSMSQVTALVNKANQE